jgi:hypothetical protein
MVIIIIKNINLSHLTVEDNRRTHATLNTVIHEITHALGFNEKYWTKFID